jgi:very-short-patch-repair endonuclease
VPSELEGLAIRSSEAPDFGVGRSRIRRSDVQHPFHGISGIELDLATTLGRCRAFEPLLLPGQVFSHTTALALLGAPLPAGEERLHLSVEFPRTPPRVRGTVGHSLQLLPMSLVLGLPIADPASAWCQAAVILRREDLVAVGDFLVTGRRRGLAREAGLVSIADLTRATIDRRGSPGAKRMVWALARIRCGAESRPETLLRLLLERSGVRGAVIDHPVTVAGGVVLHPDLAFVRERVALEYEGDGHRTDRKQWMRDLTRRELMEDAGWRVVRVTADELFDAPNALVARIRSRLANRANWS